MLVGGEVVVLEPEVVAHEVKHWKSHDQIHNAQANTSPSEALNVQIYVKILYK